MVQLLQPLVLPLTHRGIVYGMLPLTTGSKALVLCRQFSGSYAARAHVSSVCCATLKFLLTVHAWNMPAIIIINNNTHIAAIVPQPLTTHLQSWVDLLTFRPKYTFTILTNLFAILTKLTILTRIILTELTIPLPR